MFIRSMYRQFGPNKNYCLCTWGTCSYSQVKGYQMKHSEIDKINFKSKYWINFRFHVINHKVLRGLLPLRVMTHNPSAVSQRPAHSVRAQVSSTTCSSTDIFEVQQKVSPVHL